MKQILLLIAVIAVSFTSNAQIDWETAHAKSKEIFNLTSNPRSAYLMAAEDGTVILKCYPTSDSIHIYQPDKVQLFITDNKVFASWGQYPNRRENVLILDADKAKRIVITRR